MNIKNKKLLISTLVIVICILSIGGMNYKYTLDAIQSRIESKTILIDPGHGGIDPGAVSKNKTLEKDINLTISLKLKEKLQDKGYKVIMTREEDKGLYTEGGTIRKRKNEDLNNRCKLKRESNCDLFVSIHLNMFQQSKYYGAQVWYSNNEESKKIAHIVQQNLITDLNNYKRVEKPDSKIKVLKCSPGIPSILIECGFLSNPEEERKLKTEEYQHEIAESIANSIEKYFKNN